MRTSRRRRMTLLALLILSPVGVVWFLLVACSPPPDKVDVRLIGSPSGVDFLCLVADTPTGPEPMDWFTVVLGSWSPHHPDGRNARPTPGARAYSPGPDYFPVRWKAGSRYGVVTFTGGRWQAHWFRPDEVPVRRTGRLGGREVTFDLTGRVPEALTPDEVDRLGLATVPDELKTQSNP